MAELEASHWRGGVVGEPFLHGVPLIGVPIGSNHRIPHQNLQCHISFFN